MTLLYIYCIHAIQHISNTSKLSKKHLRRCRSCVCCETLLDSWLWHTPRLMGNTTHNALPLRSCNDNRPEKPHQCESCSSLQNIPTSTITKTALCAHQSFRTDPRTAPHRKWKASTCSLTAKSELLLRTGLNSKNYNLTSEMMKKLFSS